uniref:FAM65 N-terminal domain-containing protein n=1 Tax=Periophthalmus magnuspinnatus TaxID=409849 RepID=A0A3B4BD63_9GOBI
MSVKLKFDSPSDGGLVSRTRSFTGLGSLTGRRRSSSVRSLRFKGGSGTTSPRTHLSPSRGGGVMWSTQPEQVDRVFQALRKGLKEYLEGHQVEMDFLAAQQRETKRNSRLEIRALERYIRRLEFQISKVEELYETYCIQWRLCQGAVNMRRAFSLSPSTRASRESLLELSRNHRLSLQDMSSMEGELEILLGELQIKMKGLIGFARLCPGDQYEVVVRVGRQRWRIRGRIESDDTQTWDQEVMAFLPHINHNFHIKVTEAKGLGWQLVGSVTCASADFFVSKPRLMLVDITELGTIKLQLEVSWNPFDSSEKMRPLSISRQSVSSRKSSVYSWTAPNTPSFTEKYFMVSSDNHGKYCSLLVYKVMLVPVRHSISSIKESTLRSLGMIPRDTASQEELGVAPLTSGNWSLDQALETHLDICCILPKAQKTRDLLQFWEDCADNVMSAPFCCHADSFSRSLRKRYTHKVKAKQPGQSERVFAELVQQVVSVCRAVPSPWTCASPERLTVFQLSLYMKRWSISDLGEHISQLSKEEYILWSLRGPKRRKALNKLKQRHFCELLPLRQTLHTLGSLQTDPHHKVCKAAANCLSRAANNKSFRKKAVVYFTESLKSSDALVQQCSCLALKCLRATESVDYIAELWRSSNEDVRSAARETILSFGKKGHAAFQKMDQIDSELQEEAYRNLETEITIL